MVHTRAQSHAHNTTQLQVHDTWLSQSMKLYTKQYTAANTLIHGYVMASDNNIPTFLGQVYEQVLALLIQNYCIPVAQCTYMYTLS